MRQILSFAALLSLTAMSFQDKKDEEGFAPIFNGKDLDDWVYGTKGNAMKAGQGYQVDAEKKIVYCTVKDGGNLYTKKEYGDFILRFEFKLTENANNGIG